MLTWKDYDYERERRQDKIAQAKHYRMVQSATDNCESNVTKMSITLNNAVALELNSVSKELNEKKSHLVEKALRFYFDMLDETLADKRLKELNSGEVKTIPAKDVWTELGL